VQTSAFARSDTMLQLAWVIGGFIGIFMPLKPHLGLSIAFVVLTVWAVMTLVTNPQRRRRAQTPEPVTVAAG